jgi:hypothetical protein
MRSAPNLLPRRTTTVQDKSQSDVRDLTPRCLDDEEWRVWMRLVAGLWVDTGLADARVVRAGQKAVLAKGFDADAFAQDVLAAAPERIDARLVERAGQLGRDLLMMPLQRGMNGAMRKARQSGRRGLAFLLSQLLAISVYTLLLMAIVFLSRVRYEFSIDSWVDGVLEVVSLGH